MLRSFLVEETRCLLRSQRRHTMRSIHRGQEQEDQSPTGFDCRLGILYLIRFFVAMALKKSELYSSLKQGMMQELLTGRTRLV